jgi:hypothetical protein
MLIINDLSILLHWEYRFKEMQLSWNYRKNISLYVAPAPGNVINKR